MANYYDRDTESQSADTSIDVLQSEFQGIFIKDSNQIRINQTEAQALIILQIALQAALDVLLIAFDLDDNDDDVRELQSITPVQDFDIQYRRYRFHRDLRVQPTSYPY